MKRLEHTNDSKSRVINNQYYWIYAIDLYLEHQWEVTQHRSFKPVHKPFIAETPFVINSEYTVALYIGNCVREFTLNIKYTFNIIPENEPYFHPATIVCQIKDVVVAVTMEPIPVVEPSKSTLLDKTCKPKEFDSTRALFTFSVNTCGTRS
ncbi:UNVERIFIED_CONTAM: hypothetical protein FKN15_009729 [Acipenser sinensis]